MPDSFGSRGLTSQCTAQDRISGPLQPVRVADANAAQAYLQGRPDVKRSAISLMGWSNGGTAVLYTLQGNAAFAKAVAFYPGCRTLAEHGTWRTRTPLLLLMGASDRWTSPDACRTLAAAAAQRGDPVTAHFYTGAVHDFDHPGLAHRTRRGLAVTASGTGEAEVGTDPAARVDAIGRVSAFLAR
jgi:dienelactone hydrolase